ncbi:hypothetical protein BAY1663_01339 [Pseudomonas sp. BAY1663]|jgi:hypothetical protein|nr:hypothetical protein BAY1663_01339 [Pseudomonas sp. BAY1663]
MQRPEPDSDPPMPERNPKREEPGDPLPIDEPGRPPREPEPDGSQLTKLSVPAPISIGEP